MPQNPPLATTPAEQHAEGVPERILVVEDEKRIRDLTAGILCDEYSVIRAAGGTDPSGRSAAVENWKKDPFLPRSKRS